MYSLTIGTFMFNIGEMMLANEENSDEGYIRRITAGTFRLSTFIATGDTGILFINWSAGFQAYSIFYLLKHEVRLMIVSLNNRINRYYATFLVICFLQTTALIYPYARWYNWILHLYTFKVGFETLKVQMVRRCVLEENEHNKKPLPFYVSVHM